MALTFDAGGNDAGLASILRTLKKEQVTGTFFLTGDWVDTYPADARQVGGSHRLGDHSMTHPHFTRLTEAEMRREVRAGANKIGEVCAVDPAPLFRFPFGDRDARTIRVVNAAGYVPVGWTVDTLGWEGTREGISVDLIVQRVLTALRPGEIILMHVGANPYDHSTLDADALPRVVAALVSRGYRFVTLDALVG